MSNDRDYITPEGFALYRPLMMPEARSFDEVLMAVKPWNFATMNHKWGKPQADTPDEIRLPGLSRIVSRFCSVRVPGKAHLMVTPTPETLDLLGGDEFAFFDRIGFEAIYHESNDRVLIVASASSIIASRYLAYVSADSVPVL